MASLDKLANGPGGEIGRSHCRVGSTPFNLRDKICIERRHHSRGNAGPI
ncbi:MAG: hypothetical protein ACRD3W_08995 [Terriglobales bacterium]